MMNSPLPFALDVALPGWIDHATLMIELAAADDPDDPAAADDYEASAEILELFTLALGQGMLSSPDVYASAAASERSRAWDSGLPGWRFELDVSAIDPLALRVLLAMLVQSHYALEPLSRVAIRSDSRSPLSLRGADLQGNGRFPPAASRLPFALTPAAPSEWPAPGEAFSFRIELSHPVSDAQMEQLTEGLNIWDHLLVLGGFQQDYAEIEGLDDMGDIALETPVLVRHDAVKACAAHSDVNAMLNLFANLLEQGIAIRTVEIDAG